MKLKEKKKPAGNDGAAPVLAENKVKPPAVDDTIKAIEKAEKAADKKVAKVERGCGCW